MSSEGHDADSVGQEVQLSGDEQESSITEPAPPSYEEALRLFVRQSAATLAPREPASRPEAAMGGGEDQGPPGDFELAMRLQSEEMGRRNTPPSARSNSLPRQQSAVSPRGPPVTNSARFSVVSAPGDLGQRPSAHYPIGPRPMQALQTIPEGEELTIETSAPHSTDEDSSSNACCYYTCFGFPTFTNRLSPTLRKAWSVGVKHMTEMSLPVFSTRTRYILFCVQALITIACIVLSIFATSFREENLVRLVSLVAVVVVNLLERLIYWIGCCKSIRKSYDSYSDITRNFLTEIFLYPAVVASIMNALKSKSYNVVVSLWDSEIYDNTSDTALRDDAINFSLNGLVLVLFVFAVHLLRLGQLGSIVRSLLSKCKENVSGARLSSRAFIIGFFLHVLAETVVQLLFLFLIGSRIQTEMSTPSHPSVLGVSVYLLIMMVCGGLVPLSGIFLYFLSMQKWLEEFPIVLLIDHTPHNRPLSDTTLERVEWHFKALHASNTKCAGCVFGLIHPMMSPLQMLAGIIFTLLWVLFVFSFPVLELDSASVELSLGSSSSSTVVVYMAVIYGFSVIFSFLVNLLPITYGFLGMAVLPFWIPFYLCVGCYSLCYHY